MNGSSNTVLKNKIKNLANMAFRQHLISGYGDSEFPNQYQIVYQGKPRHFPLNYAFVFLRILLDLNATAPVESISLGRES